ncbi:transposase, partial [Desulfococcaceae bacterium HSG7]|nr:transposase [Desulfococcaceae bacterium HSG7]
MKIPYAKELPFIIGGLSFLLPTMTAIQYQNICQIATALILGGQMNLTKISSMLLKEKCVSTLSHFLSDAKITTPEMQHYYILNALKTYKITTGYFIVDDTMKHHSNFCKWIHGAFLLFDHALGTNVKATCIVVLYYSDGALIKFPISMRIFIKEKGKMPWLKRKMKEFKTKNMLAIEMIELALKKGFPQCTVLADAWFGVGPFIKELRRLELSYILEVKSGFNVRVKCKMPKLTETGGIAKKQYDLIKLPKFFESVSSVIKCGFA